MANDILTEIRSKAYFMFGVLGFPLILCWTLVKMLLRPFTSSEKDISGEVALVTGGANGLGREIAIQLAMRGCKIAVADINKAAAEDTATFLTEKYKVKAKAFEADVSKFEEIKTMAKGIEEQLGPVTILVNNAGIMQLSSFKNAPPEESQRMVEINLLSNLWTIRVFLEKMRQQGKGHIVAISSFAAYMTAHRHLEYTATKFAVRGLMMALRTELFATSSEFIKTTTVFPFFLDSNQRVYEMTEHLRSATTSASDAAKTIVDGIVNNSVEIFIPAITALFGRIIDLLPLEWSTKILNEIAGRENLNKLDY